MLANLCCVSLLGTELLGHDFMLCGLVETDLLGHDFMLCQFVGNNCLATAYCSGIIGSTTYC